MPPEYIVFIQFKIHILHLSIRTEKTNPDDDTKRNTKQIKGQGTRNAGESL